MGYVTSATGETTTAIFKDDLRVNENSKDLKCSDCVYIWVSILFLCIVASAAPLALEQREPALFLLFVFYLVYQAVS